MSLPKEFESVIKEEHGNFGWELANCFSFTAEFLGYKVLDISSVETAFKIIANESGSSLKNYSHPNHIPEYLKENYPKVYNVLTRRAKNVNVSNEDEECERQNKVANKFAKYTISKHTEIILFMIDEFFRDFVIDTLSLSMFD